MGQSKQYGVPSRISPRHRAHKTCKYLTPSTPSYLFLKTSPVGGPTGQDARIDFFGTLPFSPWTVVLLVFSLVFLSFFFLVSPSFAGALSTLSCPAGDGRGEIGKPGGIEAGTLQYPLKLKYLCVHFGRSTGCSIPLQKPALTQVPCSPNICLTVIEN